MMATEIDIAKALRGRGFTRRQLTKYCASMLALLAMPDRYLSHAVAAVGKAKKPVLVWLQFQDCAGCSESMLRSSHPDIAEIVLDLLSWEYHESVMAGSGAHANAVLDCIVTEEKGKHLVVVEGAIPTAAGGGYCKIGGHSAMYLAERVCRNAAATMAVGACAFDGGLVRSGPNPTGALGVDEAIPGLKIINMAGCPHNPANTAAVVVHYLTFHELPALDQHNRPLFAYGRVIHDQCERRARYDAGQFVTEWGDEGARKGWCVYKMGCKGPEATFNCPVVQRNDDTSWPVRAGHGYIGCASPRSWDHMSPFYDRLPSVPGFGVEVTAGEIGMGLTGTVLAGVAAHSQFTLIRPAPGPAPKPPPEAPLEHQGEN